MIQHSYNPRRYRFSTTVSLFRWICSGFRLRLGDSISFRDKIFNVFEQMGEEDSEHVVGSGEGVSQTINLSSDGDLLEDEVTPLNFPTRSVNNLLSCCDRDIRKSPGRVLFGV